METEFKLIGLSRPQSFTLELSHNKEIFWAKNGMGLKKFNELWNYCSGHWEDEKLAQVQHDGFSLDGTPINPVVVGISEVSA